MQRESLHGIGVRVPAWFMGSDRGLESQRVLQKRKKKGGGTTTTTKKKINAPLTSACDSAQSHLLVSWEDGNFFKQETHPTKDTVVMYSETLERYGG